MNWAGKEGSWSKFQVEKVLCAKLCGKGKQDTCQGLKECQWDYGMRGKRSKMRLAGYWPEQTGI